MAIRAMHPLEFVMRWVEAVYSPAETPSPTPKPASIPDSDVIIPRFYLLHPDPIPVIEPDDTPLIADAYLRAGGGG